MSYETIKANFDRGLWSKKMVAIAVTKGIITAGEYTEITNDKYE